MEGAVIAGGFTGQARLRSQSMSDPFATALAQQKLKNKSHSFQIGKKYTKRFCVYLFAIAFFFLLAALIFFDITSVNDL